MKSVFTSQNVLSVQPPTMVEIEIWKHADKEKRTKFTNKNAIKSKPKIPH